MFSEQIEIIFIYNLGMFNTPASVIFTAQNVPVNLQNCTVCRISDCVRTHLEITFTKFFCQILEVLFIA